MVIRDLEVKLELPGNPGEVDILIQCAATCTGTVDKAVLVGNGFRENPRAFGLLREALLELIANLAKIEEEANKPRVTGE